MSPIHRIGPILVALALAVGIRAQPVPPATGSLQVNGSTGAISGPVTAAAFRSANGIVGGSGNVTVTGGNLTVALPSATTLTLGGNFTTSGAFATTFTATANTTLTLPVTGTLATLAGAEALTGKTYNGLTITASTGALTITNLKTLSVSNTLTLAGTDGTTQTFPSTSATIARTDAGQTFTGTQTFASAPTVSSFSTAGLVANNASGVLSTTLTPTLTSLSVGTLKAADGTTALTLTSATGAAAFAAALSGTTASFSDTTQATGAASVGSVQSLGGAWFAKNVVTANTFFRAKSANGTGAGTEDQIVGWTNTNGGLQGAGMYGINTLLDNSAVWLRFKTLDTSGATQTVLTLDAAKLATFAGGVTVTGSILGSGGSAPTNTTSGSNQFTAGIATSGPIYVGGLFSLGNQAILTNVGATGRIQQTGATGNSVIGYEVITNKSSSSYGAYVELKSTSITGGKDWYLQAAGDNDAAGAGPFALLDAGASVIALKVSGGIVSAGTISTPYTTDATTAGTGSLVTPGGFYAGKSAVIGLGVYHPPQTAPASPSLAGTWAVYSDGGDGNKLKAKASTGTIVVLGTP